MILQNLTVLNFKNHLDSSIDLIDGINCFVGGNGAGKTNLLDAIHYLSLTKSYFSKQDAFNIFNQQPFMSVEGIFDKNDSKQVIQIAVKAGSKKIVKKNKKAYDRLSDHIGLFPLVMISPTDIELLNSGSDVRRKFMDTIISQFDSIYLKKLIDYSKLLLQRNALLKQMLANRSFNSSSLELYDEQIAPLAKYIFEKRKEFLQNLFPIFLNYYQLISNSDEQVSVVYQSQLSDGNYIDLVKANSNKESMLSNSVVGIHKDDLSFQLSGFPIKKRGSQGQQKTFLLSLKLAQFDFMKKALNFKPMLLLDDIFDKLDDNRVEHLMSLVANKHFGQIFVTDTHQQRSSNIFDKIDVNYQLFNVNKGTVEKIK